MNCPLYTYSSYPIQFYLLVDRCVFLSHLTVIDGGDNLKWKCGTYIGQMNTVTNEIKGVPIRSAYEHKAFKELAAM